MTEEKGRDRGLSLAPDGAFPEDTEQSHKRINKEGLAECFDTKFITALCMHWTLWVLLNLCRYCSPSGSTFVFRERFWKEIKDVRLLAWFLKNYLGKAWKSSHPGSKTRRRNGSRKRGDTDSSCGIFFFLRKREFACLPLTLSLLNLHTFSLPSSPFPPPCLSVSSLPPSGPPYPSLYFSWVYTPSASPKCKGGHLSRNAHLFMGEGYYRGDHSPLESHLKRRSEPECVWSVGITTSPGMDLERPQPL